LPYDLPLGIELYSEVYSTPVRVDSLAAERQDEAIDHTLRSHDDAADLLADLEGAAEPPLTQPAGGRSKGGGGHDAGGSGAKKGNGGKQDTT
jgi:hypothetical protein